VPPGEDLTVLVVRLSVGLLCGLLPLLVGLVRGHKALAWAGLFCCGVSGAAAGLFMAVPVALLFAVIAGRPLPEPEPVSAPVKEKEKEKEKGKGKKAKAAPEILDALPVVEAETKPRRAAATTELDPLDLHLELSGDVPESDHVPVAKPKPQPAPKSEAKPRQAPPRSEAPRQPPTRQDPPRQDPPKRKPKGDGFGYVELD
jgi:hypothetical protein